jgi:FAD/FMN-containing dehydrogenase
VTLLPEEIPVQLSAATPSPTEALRGLCGGAVHLPGDPAYDQARMPWDVHADSYPLAVAYPAFPDEVAEVLRAAQAAGMQVAPQGTGHGAAALGGRLSGAVLLRTSAMTELVVDPERRTARVGAGVQWSDVVDRAADHGLAGLHMSGPDVGVVGSSLGGGISWYARRYGLQCSALTAVEVVLHDGTLVRATDDESPDLMWAARGGGGGFGVVTAVEFELVALRTAYAGMLVWDWADAERVLPEWAAWSVDAPEDVTTSFRLFHVPDVPAMPAEVRGRSVALVDGAVLGDPAAAADVLAPLRALRPYLDTFAERSVRELPRLHLDPEGPTPAYIASRVLDALPGPAIDVLLAAVGPGSGSSLVFAELRQLGGALARRAPRPGALDGVPGAFLALALGVDPDPAALPRLRADAARMLDAVAPWDAGRQYLPMLHEGAGQAAWGDESYARLQAVRAAADPTGMFVPTHVPMQRR